MGKQAAASLKTRTNEKQQQKPMKRKKPANIPRELYNLISNNPTQSEEINNLLQSTKFTPSSHYNKKLIINQKRPCRKWMKVTTPFKNRGDGVSFEKWIREDNVEPEVKKQKIDDLEAEKLKMDEKSKTDSETQETAQNDTKPDQKPDQKPDPKPESQKTSQNLTSCKVPELTDELYTLVKQKAKTNSCTMQPASICPLWTRRETEALLAFVKQIGERFVLIHDFWQTEIKTKKEASEQCNLHDRTIDEIKARYYQVKNCMHQLKGETDKIIHFDLEHEIRRKQQLDAWYERTPQEVEEEVRLIDELHKIQQRRRERLIHANAVLQFVEHTAAAQKKLANSVSSGSQSDENSHTMNVLNTAGVEFAHSLNPNVISNKNRSVVHKTASRAQLRNPKNAEKAILLAYDFMAGKYLKDGLEGVARSHYPSGVYMRSQIMKIAKKPDIVNAASANRKNKHIAQMFEDYCNEVERFPMSTKQTVDVYNQLRTDVMKLSEIKTAITDLNTELGLLQQKRKMKQQQEKEKLAAEGGLESGKKMGLVAGKPDNLMNTDGNEKMDD